MTDTRLLEIQARQMEGNPLSGPEALELDEARKGNGHMARLLKEDFQLHSDLLELHRIEASAEAFAERCAAPVSGSEATVRTLVPGLDVASPLDRLRRSQPKRILKTGRAAGWIAAVAASALVVVGAWWWIPRTENSPVQIAGTMNRNSDIPRVEPPVTQPAMDEVPDSQLVVDKVVTEPVAEVMPQRALAKMRYTPESEWEKMPVEGFSYPAEYKLRSGVAEVVLDDGTEVVFQGPAIMTLESPRQVRVDEGRFRIQPVAGKGDFSITTPTVWLKGQDELLAHLDVGPVDGTLVQLERGGLKARPWGNGRAEELSLAASGMDRGIFGPAWHDDSSQPATAVALNENGEFNSLVAAGDRSLRISSPTVFAQVLDMSRTMIREDRKQFPQQWQGMVESLENSASSTDLNINGNSVRPTSPEDMMEQFNRIREQMMKGMGEGVGGNSSSAFSGMLNVNGQQQRFTSPEEFLEAQRKMFGPMFGRMMGQMPAGTTGSGTRTSLPTGESNSMSAFSGMINNNGQVMQFTSPEDFQRSMQQLRPRR